MARKNTPAVATTSRALDFDQRQRASMALQQLAESMRASLASADSGADIGALGDLAEKMRAYRDKIMADAEDSERMASLFRNAREVELRFDNRAGVVSDDATRTRELQGLVEFWTSVGVQPGVVAAALFAAGARMFASLGIDPEDALSRIRIPGAAQTRVVDPTMCRCGHRDRHHKRHGVGACTSCDCPTFDDGGGP